MDDVDAILRGWRLDIQRRIMAGRPVPEAVYTAAERTLRYQGYLDGQYDMLTSVLYLLECRNQDTRSQRTRRHAAR